MKLYVFNAKYEGLLARGIKNYLYFRYDYNAQVGYTGYTVSCIIWSE